MCKSTADTLDRLVRFSRSFGEDPSFVLAGGGNSSYKEHNLMLVKGSGSRMATITGDGFVAMDRSALNAIWDKPYPENADLREEAVLADLMAARMPGEEEKRPSVETLLHSLFPEPWVMHTHPALVNGLTCSLQGKEAMQNLFGSGAVWIPVIEPGYTLAKAVRQALDASPGDHTPLVFLQNHGVFITGKSEDEIRKRYKSLFAVLRNAAEAEGVSTQPYQLTDSDHEGTGELFKAFEELTKDRPEIISFTHPLLKEALSSREGFAPLQEPFTPDHIVYAGFHPHYTTDTRKIKEELESYLGQWKEFPKIVASPEGTCWAIGGNRQAAIDARDLFIDSVMVLHYTKAFGGPSPMPDWLVSFIRNWEAEKYRQKKG